MSDETVQGILQAATQIFAAKGYDGARVDEIAQAAGVNKATLYYRVGDKAALYGAVLEGVIGATADRIQAAVRSADSAREQVRAYVREIALSAHAVPQFVPLMMREVADGGRNLPDAPLRQMARIVNLLEQALKAGEASGEFRAAHPFITHMLVIGTVMFFNAGAPIRARIAADQGLQFRPNVDFPPDFMVEHLTDLVLHSLKN